ncbi:MAG: hybrid sensor histidine kinase/response regulator [Treponema sp.]|nr:hybrid sensor histidine kinase/response regulator [Treponema sp.]
MLLGFSRLSKRGRLAARWLGGFAVAAAGAALTRYFSLDLAFGLTFLAGNTLGVLAVFILPWPANVLGTFLTMLPTIVLWGHPWSLPPYLLEGLMLGLLLRRGHFDKILVAESLYWLFVGVPLTFLSYAFLFGMSVDGAVAAAIKQGANAVVDAFIGVALYFAGRRIPAFASPSRRRQSGRENLVFLLDGLLIVPLGAILLFYTSNIHQITVKNIDARTDYVMSMTSESLAENSFSILRTVLREQGYSALILSPSGSTIWSLHPLVFAQSDATARLLGIQGTTIILGPEHQSNPMRVWMSAVVRTRKDLPDGGTIFLEQPFGPYVEDFYRSMTAIFAFFLLMLTAAGVAAYTAALVFLRPLELLRRTAESVQTGDRGAKWPEKGIQEIRELRDSLVAMTGAVMTKEMELSEAKAAAESLLRRSERYTAFIAHEVKAPLAAILSAIEASGESAEVRAGLVPIIVTSLQRLVELVDDILDQASAGSVAAGLRHRRPFALAKEAEETLAPFAIQARRKGLEFSSAIDLSPARTVVGDPLQFRQVLANLVSNALKYTGSGFVRVALGAREIEGACLVLGSVADSGRGIEPDLLDDIWKPFAAGKGRLADGQSSHGLGLSVVRRIVEGSGGSIRVESAEGRGSTFSFEMRFDEAVEPPAVAAAKPQAAARPAAAPDLRSVSILVADDDLLSRMASSHFLRKWGARIDEAEDGAGALRLAESKAYDLVLLDEHMPGANGMEVARRLRRMEAEKGRARSGIFLSSAESAERFQAFVPAVIDAVVAKPVRAETLGRLLAPRFPVSADTR